VGLEETAPSLEAAPTLTDMRRIATDRMRERIEQSAEAEVRARLGQRCNVSATVTTTDDFKKWFVEVTATTYGTNDRMPGAGHLFSGYATQTSEGLRMQLDADVESGDPFAGLLSS
jgi:hypothetical protein